jgi:hypothetical protein
MSEAAMIAGVTLFPCLGQALFLPEKLRCASRQCTLSASRARRDALQGVRNGSQNF